MYGCISGYMEVYRGIYWYIKVCDGVWRYILVYGGICKYIGVWEACGLEGRRGWVKGGGGLRINLN